MVNDKKIIKTKPDIECGASLTEGSLHLYLKASCVTKFDSATPDVVTGAKVGIADAIVKAIDKSVNVAIQEHVKDMLKKKMGKK